MSSLLISSLKLAVALVVATPTYAAAREARLDGWGNYRLGMTVEQASRVRGVSLSNVTFSDYFGSRFALMESLAPVQSDGYSFNLSLYFTPPQRLRLSSIDLAHPGTQDSLAACEIDFENLLRPLEMRYGALSPPVPQPFNLFDVVGKVVEQKDLPGGSSRFDIRLSESGNGPPGYTLKAARTTGTVTVSLEAQYGTFGTAPNRSCDMYVRFANPAALTAP